MYSKLSTSKLSCRSLKGGREEALNITNHAFYVRSCGLLWLSVVGTVADCRQSGDPLFLTGVICAGLSQVVVHFVEAPVF